MEGGMQADLCPLPGSASVPPDALGSNWGQLRADFLPDGDLLIAFELHLTRTNAFHCASPKALLTEDAAQRLVCVCGGGGGTQVHWVSVDVGGHTLKHTQTIYKRVYTTLTP